MEGEEVFGEVLVGDKWRRGKTDMAAKPTIIQKINILSK